MSIKVYCKKIIVIAIVSLVVSKSLFCKDLTGDVQVHNDAYVIENTKQDGNNVKFDIWNDGAADAVAEIFDKNGESVGWTVIKGDKKSSDFVEGVVDNFKKTGKDIQEGNFDLSDPRSHHVSKKTSVDLDVPEGGSFKISKTSDIALAVNLANTGIEMLGKIGLPSSMFGKSAADAFAKAFAESLLKSPILESMTSKSNNTEYGNKELLAAVLKVGVGVLKSGAIAGLDNALKEQLLKKLPQNIAKKGLGGLISGAEMAVFLLETDMVRMDINRHYKNKEKLDVHAQNNEKKQTVPSKNSIQKNYKPARINIKNSKISSKTSIGKGAVVKNSNLGNRIKGKNINIKNSKLITKTTISRGARVSNSNLGNKITGKNVNISNSRLKTKVIINKGAKVSNTNLGTKITGKNVNITNSKIYTKTRITGGSTIKNSNLGTKLSGRVRNVNSSSNVKISRGTKIKNSNLGVSVE